MKRKMSWLAVYAVAIFTVVAGGWSAPASAAVSPVWHAMPGSTINSDGTLTLTGGSTSVEGSGNFGTVDAADVIKLTYTLSDGAQCIGGAPRVYAEIGGEYANSWDQHIGDGVPAACAAELVVPKAGAVTAMGVVYDNGGAGTVTVTSLTIAGTAVDFKATTGEPDESPSPTASPTVSPTVSPTASPTASPTGSPTSSPTGSPTTSPSQSGSASPTPTGSATGTPSASASASVVPGAVDGGTGSGGLPLTGAGVLKVAGIGGLLIAAGGLLLVWVKRRNEDAVETA